MLSTSISHETSSVYQAYLPEGPVASEIEAIYRDSGYSPSTTEANFWPTPRLLSLTENSPVAYLFSPWWYRRFSIMEHENSRLLFFSGYNKIDLLLQFPPCSACCVSYPPRRWQLGSPTYAVMVPALAWLDWNYRIGWGQVDRRTLHYAIQSICEWSKCRVSLP